MSRFQGIADFKHDQAEPIGILLTNLGTPEAPTKGALRKYLRQFLGDPRVVEVPRPIWWMVLNLVILNTRPKKSAAMYERVWTEDGSPLMEISKRQAKALQRRLDEQHGESQYRVELAMRYGQPSIAAGLRRLRDAGARRILVFPLYPQYSATTTGSTFDAVSSELQRWRWIPELRFINQYHDEPGYIDALVKQIEVSWSTRERPDKLLFSFHGIPKQYFMNGDPYHCHCHKTARLVTERLGLERDDWELSFQSRVGPKEWLKPYTDKVLQQWGKKGVKNVHVVCPGFSADCLETIDEIAHENREEFLEAGGETFHYIPALNDTPEHIDALRSLVETHTQGWHERIATPDERAQSSERARAMGAEA